MSIRRRRLVWGVAAAAATTLAATLGVTWASHAEVEEAAGCTEVSEMYEVCLTRPDQQDSGVDFSIVNRLTDYVEATEEGDVIRGALFTWDLFDGHGEEVPEVVALLDAVVEAHNSGVDVRIVLDGNQDRNDEVADRLRAAGVPRSLCDGGCLPNGVDDKTGSMHMKFFTFSSGGEYKVAHTSSNMTKGQAGRHQNLLSVTGDEKLYDNYVGYWNRMKERSWTYEGVEWTGKDRARVGDTPGIKSYFFPRQEADPIRGTLEHLTCSEGNDRIWVAASLFYTDERLPVLQVLDDLESSGCDVRVVVAGDDDYKWVNDNSNLDSVRQLDAGANWGSHHN
ncbi:MAG: phospholipase D-like domain-containing protein, partial [Stackebrandtia sp.]